VSASPSANWSLREASAHDGQWIAELRAVVLRPDLERLSRFDPVRVRQRFLAAFEPASTRVVLVDGLAAGSIAVRADTPRRCMSATASSLSARTPSTSSW
jgi:hypothetical protein